MKKPLIILGAGGHAKVLIDIIRQSESYYLEAVIGQEHEANDTILDFPILKGDQYLLEYKNKGILLIANGVGGYTSNEKRIEIYRKLIEMGFDIINLIHSSTVIAPSVKMGKGIVIYPGVSINSDVQIGNNVIIATGADIDHEAQIYDHVIVSTGVSIGAGTIIEEGTILGVGAKTVPRLNICQSVLVGAGAVVTRDIIEPGVYVGIPARKVSH
jgi:sugar O-acyltransferase (sialic acid O-acetyltransferase NeuD family)